MAIIIGVVSQKGGVGKSTIARLVAREFAAQGWQVKIGDLDIGQATSFHWRSRRLQSALEPDISIEQFGRVEQALKASPFNIVIAGRAARTSTHNRPSRIRRLEAVLLCDRIEIGRANISTHVESPGPEGGRTVRGPHP